jgi:hypothetical protein
VTRLTGVGLISADEYLERRYEACECPPLPMRDEEFAVDWETWLKAPEEAPCQALRDALTNGKVRAWIERSPYGGIPVLYALERGVFEALVSDIYDGNRRTLPASVNAFTIKSKQRGLEGHRVILLNRSGYSGILGADAGCREDEWMEKSMTIRLNHEVCHYMSLRVLGGMQNHALDEIAADCAGQLAAFGAFRAALQKKFFGISDGNILPGGRFSFYVKNLREEDIGAVLDETEAALAGLEDYLSKNPDMARTPNRPRLVLKLLTTGIQEIRCLT